MNFFGLVFCLFYSIQIYASTDKTNTHPDIFPDISNKDYQQLWQKYSDTKKGNEIIDPNIKEAISAGEKLYSWIRLINSTRPEENKIKLTGPGTLRGIPIDQPMKYSPAIIADKLIKIKKELNVEMSEIIFSNAPVKSEINTSNEEFIKNAREISRGYDHAVRWQTNMLPYLNYYKNNAKYDVRGFYYLSKVFNLDLFLTELILKPRNVIEQYRQYLKMLCLNNDVPENICNPELNNSFAKNNLVEFKNKYWEKAQYNWEKFFKITSPRTDVSWGPGSEQTMSLNFRPPENEAIKEFLQKNIEDEFKIITEGVPWQFKLNFADTVTAPYIIFEAGITPNVKLGNIIYMDRNIDLSDFENSWVIRHEFGHVLRLPDCYIEFYDEKEQAGVSYQLDTTDLMCSRTGKFNNRIFLELKKYYYTNSIN